MTEKDDIEFMKKEREKEELINNILNIKRQIEKENDNETLEIKLGRRLEQRSNKKLSKEILEHIITRYEIDNNNLPTKELLIKLMNDFLGNIQKTPDNYNLKNEKEEINLKDLNYKIGSGKYGQIYSFKPDNINTKKKYKALAYKLQEKGIPYDIDIHITSAILLALYDFQPKYYNQYFMEVGNYYDKSNQRKFEKVLRGLIYSQILNEGNIKWYILFNFTNIRDQVHNLMRRAVNNEFTKIDIGSLNSEFKLHNIKKNLDIFNEQIIKLSKYKDIIKKELNKILIISEEFLIDLIIFRTRRGCFYIDKEDLAIQFECISSSYKVIQLTKEDNFFNSYHKYKKTFNNKHYENNLSLSWMLYYLSKKLVLNAQEYKEYIYKFNDKSKNFSKMAEKIRQGEFLLEDDYQQNDYLK